MNQYLRTSIFDKWKKILLKWKIVHNCNAKWNFSKFVDIYDTAIDLDTSYPFSNESRAILVISTVHLL